MDYRAAKDPVFGEDPQCGDAPRSLAEESIDRLNRAVYSKPSVVNAYHRWESLLEAEQKILETIRPSVAGKRILDIGVGGGRTTRLLNETGRQYTAIDYSPRMVEAVREKSALSAVYCCDARDMRRFGDSSFDFILFSFNGLDYMSHSDRLKALGEIYRVLACGGLFMFSSHNRSSDSAQAPWNRRSRRLSLSFAKAAIAAMLAMPRHWRMRQYEVRENEYAILNDEAFGYSLMTYYIEISSQLAQLRTFGFASACAFDLHGLPVTEDRDSPWISYVAGK